MKTPGTTGIALVLTLALLTTAESDDEFEAAAFVAKAEAMRQDAGVPGMAVAILHDGQPILLQGFGTAGPDGQAVTTQTAFSTGSITKSFVALLIQQLASEGRLELDAPVVRYLPDFRTRDRSQSDRITIDHVVTHRSGLTTLDGNSANSVDPGLQGPAAAVASLAGVELFAEPGTTFQYSNANYALLSQLIEVLDERTFEQALQMRIFDPLGMNNSFVQLTPASTIPLATPYRLWFGLPRPWQPAPAEEPDRRMIGAGGISSSIEDLARFVEAVRTRDPRVVPADADRLFATNPVTENWGYGYGWFTGLSGEAPYFEHSGFTPGFFTLATIVPAEKHVVVVLTNLSGLAHGDLPRAVTNAALGWDPVPAAPAFSARLAIWSAVMAPVGLLLLLYKSGRQLATRGKPMRPVMRGLNVVAALVLLAGAYAAYVGYPLFMAVSYPTAFAFFPDLTLTAVSAIVLLLVLAASRVVLAIRGD